MRTKKARTLVLLIAVAGSLTAACSSDSDTDVGADAAPKGDAKQELVVIKDFAFERPQLSIPRGTAVQWRNDDTFRHTVTSGATSGAENKADGTFDLDMPDKGKTVSFTFNEPGTFTYFCRQHNAMDGTVTVS